MAGTDEEAHADESNHQSKQDCGSSAPYGALP